MLSSNVSSILQSMYPVRSELVPCFIGAPGIGKTQGIQQFAKEKGVKVVTYILSCALPSEVSGIRMPDTDTKMLEVFDDARMASLEDGDILFFDEILEAPPALWSACLTLIQDRMLASGRMLPDVMIVAASNPLSNPGIIPSSLRDRFMFFELEWDSDAWISYMRNRYQITGNINDWGALTAQIVGGLNEPQRYGYNTLTPRRVTKLFDWLANADEDARGFIKDYIESMFNLGLTENINELLFNSKLSQLSRVCHDMVNELHIDFGELDLIDITPKKLFDFIDSLSPEEAEDIKEYLQRIEVEDV